MTEHDRNAAAVRTVCERWPWLTLDEWRSLLAENCQYRNIPVDGDLHVGPDAAHAAVSRLQGSWDITLEIGHVVVNGDVVLTERNEHFVHKAGSKPTFDLPVMGTFELHDGKITAWRDYFELSQMKLR